MLFRFKVSSFIYALVRLDLYGVTDSDALLRLRRCEVGIGCRSLLWGIRGRLRRRSRLAAVDRLAFNAARRNDLNQSSSDRHRSDGLLIAGRLGGPTCA